MSASTEQNMSAEGPQETVRFKNERALIWVLDIGIAICVWQLFQAFTVIPFILSGFIRNSWIEHVHGTSNTLSEATTIITIAVAVGVITWVWWTVWQRVITSYRHRFLGSLWSGTFAYIVLLVYQLFSFLDVYEKADTVYDYIKIAMQFVIFWSCVTLLPLLCQWRCCYGVKNKRLMISCFHVFVAIFYYMCVINIKLMSFIKVSPFIGYSTIIVLIFVGAKSLHSLCSISKDEVINHNVSDKYNRPDVMIWLLFWCMVGSLLFVNKGNEIYFVYNVSDYNIVLGLSFLSLIMTALGLVFIRKFILMYSIDVVIKKGVKIAGLAILLLLIIEFFQYFIGGKCYVRNIFYDCSGQYSITYTALLVVRECVIRILLGGVIAVVIGTLGDQRYRSLENNEVMPLTCSMFILGVVFNYAGYFHTLHVDYIDPYYKLLFIASACGLLYRLRVRRRQREAIAVPR